MGKIAQYIVSGSTSISKIHLKVSSNDFKIHELVSSKSSNTNEALTNQEQSYWPSNNFDALFIILMLKLHL